MKPRAKRSAPIGRKAVYIYYIFKPRAKQSVVRGEGDEERVERERRWGKGGRKREEGEGERVLKPYTPNYDAPHPTATRVSA